MAEHHEDRDPMVGQTFTGISGNPIAGMPEPPPVPGEAGKRGQGIGPVIFLAVLLLLLVMIIFF